MEIDGRTRVVPHLAFPSAHLRTPSLFNARCVALGLNAVVVPWQVAPDALAEAIAGLSRIETVPGCIITIPHKEAVATHCARLEGVADLLAVANIMRREADGSWTGRNLDGDGFVGGLKAQGIGPAGMNVLLLGAGGAATALAAALLDAGVARLVVANRGMERAARLVERLSALHRRRDIATGSADGAGFDLIVNATSVGLDGDPASPLPAAAIPAGAIVAEIIMKPALTPLLREARERGARIHFGEHMLTAQIDGFITFLLGEPAVAAIAAARQEPREARAS
jgi:shikimate dehydrogenase